MCSAHAGAKFLYLREPVASAASAGFVPVLDAPAPKAVVEAAAALAPAQMVLEGKAAAAPVHIMAQDAAASNASSIPVAEAVAKAVHVVGALEHAVGMAA